MEYSAPPIPNFSLLLAVVLQGNHTAIAKWKTYARGRRFSQENITMALTEIDTIKHTDVNYPHALMLKGYIYGFNHYKANKLDKAVASRCYEAALQLGQTMANNPVI